MLKLYKYVYRSRVITRFLTSRADIQKSLDSVKRTSINRAAAVEEIHKTWEEYNRARLVSEDDSKEEYNVESMLGEKILSESHDFGKVLKKRETRDTKKKHENDNLTFPLKSLEVEKKTDVGELEKVEEQNDVESLTDRGFFVNAGMYVDEYIAGSSLDLDPGDAMISSRQYFGSDDAVEHISFQLPGQKLAKEQAFSLDETNEIDLTVTGTVIEEMPASAEKCCGCGANFHCKDSSLPGFVPFEIFEKIENKMKKNVDSSLCKRCHLLQTHNFLLNVNVCDVDYAAMMSELKKQPEALVVLVVDVTDLPASILPGLADVIGSRKPMVVVGNKVDLLPPDARTGYMYRFKEAVEKAVEKSGLKDSFNILHTALVSAKTGYGIEDLITEIYMKYTNVKMGVRGNIFLVGCTNAGKSTMFNALLQSDLCKVRAVDLIDRATTSIWPGTTISLLKFPIMKPSPYKLEMRRRRLLAHRAWVKKEMYARKMLLAETGDDQFAIPTALIQNTFKESEEELQPMAIDEIVGEGITEKEEKNNDRVWSLDDKIFSKGKWCYDTPGTINENQVLSLFTLEELVNVVPRKLLRPRTAIVYEGETLMIGGVGRIDVESADKSVLLTTFVNMNLPLNIMRTEEVDGFLSKWNGTAGLVVPKGGEVRMKDWPGLGGGRKFEMIGKKDEGCCDIVLSSIGWVMVTSDRKVSLRAFSPGGKGLTARIQPLLPFSASLRGKRIPGTPFYKVQPIEFPVNLRRKRAEARKRRKN